MVSKQLAGELPVSLEIQKQFWIGGIPLLLSEYVLVVSVPLDGVEVPRDRGSEQGGFRD